MNSEKLLRQYVDTGIVIPEKQFDKLLPNLRKTYLRKRLIAIIDGGSHMEHYELKSFNPEQISKLQTYPRFITYFHGLDREKILTDFYNTLDKKSNDIDVGTLINYTPIGPKLDAVIDKIFNVFGKDINFYNVVAEMMTKYNDLDLKMQIAYRYLDAIGGELTVNNVVEMGHLRDMYRYYICKKLIDDHPVEKWLKLIHYLFYKNMSEEYLVPILNSIFDKGYKIYSSVSFATSLKKISDKRVMLDLIEKSFINSKSDDVWEFKDLFTYANDVMGSLYLNILELYLKHRKSRLYDYEIEFLLEKCPQEQIVEAKSMIHNATSTSPNTLNEHIKRIKELL